MVKIDSNLRANTTSNKRRFHIEEAILILLLIFSLVGVGLTDASPADGYWYWMIMIFVFGLAAIVTGLVQSKREQGFVKDLLFSQAIHWLGSMGVVAAAFSILHAGIISEKATGLVILLILALATFLDGIRLGWRFSMTGVFLGITAVIAAHVEEFMWIILVLAAFIVTVTILWDNRKNRNLA